MDKRKNSLRPIAMFESIRISPKATLKVRNNPVVDPNKQTKIIEMQILVIEDDQIQSSLLK